MGWMLGAEGSGDDGKGRSIRTIFILYLSSCEANKRFRNGKNEPAEASRQVDAKLPCFSRLGRVQQIRRNLNFPNLCTYTVDI